MSFRVLVVDDDADVLKAAYVALSARGASVEFAAEAEGLGRRVIESPFDVVLLDMNFALGERSGREGLDGLAEARAADPALSIVLMTTYGGVALAVDALKRGATDFVLKPWRNDALAAALTIAAEKTRERRGPDGRPTLDQVERQTIEKALADYGGNVSRAARALGLTRPSLYRRMERHGL